MEWITFGLISAISMNSHSAYQLVFFKIWIKLFVLFLLIGGGFSYIVRILLPQQNGAIEIRTILEICFGVGLIGISVILLRHWNWLRVIPNSGLGRIYFGFVYGILLTWSITCYSWGQSFRGSLFPLPYEVTSQITQLLTLCAMPPIAGMSIDLLIAKWTEKRYQQNVRTIGLILMAVFIMVVGIYLV
jgi:hypothetical protein